MKFWRRRHSESGGAVHSWGLAADSYSPEPAMLFDTRAEAWQARAEYGGTVMHRVTPAARWVPVSGRG